MKASPEESKLTLPNERQLSIAQIAKEARSAAGVLARLSASERQSALQAMADEIDAGRKIILEANAKDLEAAAKNGTSTALINRLKLDANKLDTVSSGIRQIALAQDPLGQVSLHTELDRELNLKRVACPIGVIAVIFESRPDVLPQIAALCLKSGNAVILKGGKEAEHSNRALFECIAKSADKANLPRHSFTLLEKRTEIEEILKSDKDVDLIIPRGSNELVRHIQSNTRIPVLGHADGICHIFIDEKADRKKAIDVVLDAKVQYPAACNSVETLLIHESLVGGLLPELIQKLVERKVEVRCDRQCLETLPSTLRAQVKEAREEDWASEYCDLILSVKAVSSRDEAIDHINNYGSHHTESIITQDQEAFDDFFARVNSAGVYHNASTRFADGFRYGFGAEVGISTGKLHPRGPVGVEGLVTYKYQLKGDGHVVSDYVGPSAREFTHEKKPID